MYRLNKLAKWTFSFCTALLLLKVLTRNRQRCTPIDWHDYNRQKMDAARKGYGENGTAYIPVMNEMAKKLADSLYRANGYNAYISDALPLYRSIKDTRPKVCQLKKYCNNLPDVSIIIPFHNEHYSVLLRAVYTILMRTPTKLLTEIILVDDASTKPQLKTPLRNYVETAKLDKVHFVNAGRANGKREGLIRAKVKGSKAAKGKVLVFMDAHSEVGYNWLPPLLDPIVKDRRTVTSPNIDIIDCETFEVRNQGSGARGIFNWKFEFKNVPANITPLHEPFDNPIMAGGYFAIERQWFEDLGWYDEELMIWGGEQYELSFKIWQCHGRLIDVPCSHIGHIYRCKYGPFENPGLGDFLARNYKRVAEVWMDEYKEHIYRRKNNIRTADAGDLSKQLAIRERLKCKSFKWYMETVMYDQAEHYPIFEPEPLFRGYLYNRAVKLCLSLMGGKMDNALMHTCESTIPLQLDTYNRIREINEGELCLDAGNRSDGEQMIMYGCHKSKGNQYWSYKQETEQIYQNSMGKCLTATTEGLVTVHECNEDDVSQKWIWKSQL